MLKYQIKLLIAWVTYFLLLQALHFGVVKLGSAGETQAEVAWGALFLVVPVLLMTIICTASRVVGFALSSLITLCFGVRRWGQIGNTLADLRYGFFNIFHPPWPQLLHGWWWYRVFRLPTATVPDNELLGCLGSLSGGANAGGGPAHSGGCVCTTCNGVGTGTRIRWEDSLPGYQIPGNLPGETRWRCGDCGGTGRQP
jgi:hypothetical protein